MKLKTLSLTIGVCALTLTANPFTVQAQPNFPGSRPGSEIPSVEASGQDSLARLGLTSAQKRQIQRINLNSRRQIEAILKPAQKDKLQAAIQSGQSQRQAFESLELSGKQRSQIQKVIVSSRQQLQRVLTPKQRQQIKQIQQNSPSSEPQLGIR